MLHQQTHSRSSTPPGQARPKVKALHNGGLHTRLKEVVEVMGSRIPEGENPIRSRLRRREEWTQVVSAWKQGDRDVWITRR